MEKIIGAWLIDHNSYRKQAVEQNTPIEVKIVLLTIKWDI